MKLENLGIRETKKLLIWLYNKVVGLDNDASSSNYQQQIDNLSYRIGQTNDNVIALNNTLSSTNDTVEAMGRDLENVMGSLPVNIRVLTEAQYEETAQVGDQTLYFILP